MKYKIESGKCKVKNIFLSLSILLLISTLDLHSQNYLGFESSNFSGAIGADANPAFVADNIYKFDLIILGASGFFENNYQTFTPSFTSNIPRNNEVKYAYSTAEVRLLSFTYTLSPIHGFAFSSKFRAVANADNFTPEFINGISGKFSDSGLFNQSLFNQGGRIDVMSWQEYSLTYGRVLKFNEDHYFKGGLSLKGLVPMASAYGVLSSLSYTSLANDSIALNDVQFEYSNSANFDNITNGGSFSRAKGIRFGFDLGIVYENRPQQRRNPTYSNGRDFKPILRNDRPYRFRLGLSILDIGRLKFSHGANAVSANGILTSNISIEQQLRELASKSVESYLDSIGTILNLEKQEGKYSMGLPTRMRIESDINLHRGFYLNIASELSLRAFKFSDRSVHSISSFAITPRVENDIFGAYLPLYANIEGQKNVGVAFRAGPLVLGVHDILPLLGRKKIESLGAYVVLKTFIIQKNKIKEELKCDDLYDGWRSVKRRPSGRAKKNVGESPKVNQKDSK